MNDDLISRKAFIEELKLYCNRTFLGEITAQSEISIGELSTIIKNLPVAYDVDLVSDEILYIFHDEISAVFEESNGEGTTKKIDWILKMYKKINDVVKNGRIK